MRCPIVTASPASLCAVHVYSPISSGNVNLILSIVWPVVSVVIIEYLEQHRAGVRDSSYYICSSYCPAASPVTVLYPNTIATPGNLGSWMALKLTL